MKRIICNGIFLCICLISFSQTTVNGIVTDKKGTPIEGANVYLEGTYDGGSTDAKGNFSFETTEDGTLTLVVSYLTFETYTKTASVDTFKNLAIALRESVNSINGVTLTAGTFEAGDNAKVSALKPLDVVTTASALGDYVGALQTLPGTSTVAEDGRLFVRGGDAGETQIFIDGIRVFAPFPPSANNIPTRGRYSPFLFKGITFSTGGYSAEYGQALSSVLLLNTIDEPDQNKTDITLMTVGGGLGHTKKWEKSSISINTSYINLAPYTNLIPDRNEYRDPFQGFAGEAVYRRHFENALFKFYAAFDHSSLDVFQEDINFEDLVRFRLNNNNFYLNSSYKGFLANNWVLDLGGSFTYGTTKLGFIDNNIDDIERSVHAKIKLKKGFSNRFKLNFGAEYFFTNFDEDFNNTGFSGQSGFDDQLYGAFAETDIFFSSKLALKTGVRIDHTTVLNETYVSPRVAFAYKTGEYGQISLAYGDFYQNPNRDFLKFDQQLEAEKATHYILNYQYNNNGKTFRAEAFYKDYDDLLRFDTDFITFNSTFSNSGSGYAGGVDIFWRDNSSIKKLDYWVSYSYLDTERIFRNFPERATPNFANTHNLSLVGKYWVESWKSQIGFAYNYGSGRSFTDPNTGLFLSERTKSFNSLSLNWAYLISQQKILYFSISNVLGFRNVNGFQFANTPNSDGVFESRPLRPAADQFFFVGFFWTISTDKKSNQLNNL